MKVDFTCPSCGGRFRTDAAHAGRSTRCPKCGGPVTIPAAQPSADEPAPGWQGLETPRPAAAERFDEDDEGGLYALGEPAVAPPPVFVPARAKGDPVPPTESQRRRRSPSRRRDRAKGDPLRRLRSPWLVWAAVLLAGFGLAATLVPGGGNYAGIALSIVGLFVFLAGYVLGAYVAFTEDSLHGLLYILTFPFYASYYIVVNWDEMWPAFVAMIGGMGLIGIGSLLLDPEATGEPEAQAARPPAMVRPIA